MTEQILTGKTIAVTGASGMLGAYICRSLLREGAKVVGVVRNPDKARFLADEGVEFRKADLNDQPALASAFAEVDAIVSNAAMYVATKSMAAYEEHKAANLEGTRNVFEAANSAGVRRAVHVSTFGIYRWRIGRPIHEETPQLNGAKKQGGPYRATKQESEALAWQLSQKYGIDLTTVRPSGIYGARDGNLLQPVYKVLQWPVAPAPGLRFPIVYAGDVADAIATSLGTEAAKGQAYNTGGDDLSFGSFMHAVRAGMQRGAILFPLPVPLAIVIDNAKAQRDLGFRNRPFAEALQEIWKEELPPNALAALRG